MSIAELNRKTIEERFEDSEVCTSGHCRVVRKIQPFCRCDFVRGSCPDCYETMTPFEMLDDPEKENLIELYLASIGLSTTGLKVELQMEGPLWRFVLGDKKEEKPKPKDKRQLKVRYDMDSNRGRIIDFIKKNVSYSEELGMKIVSVEIVMEDDRHE